MSLTNDAAAFALICDGMPSWYELKLFEAAWCLVDCSQFLGTHFQYSNDSIE